MKKRIWIAIGIAGWLLLVVFISWNFGWKAIKARENRAYLRGVNDAVSQVIAQAQQGEVIINTNNGQLVLVVKPKPEKKAEVN